MAKCIICKKEFTPNRNAHDESETALDNAIGWDLVVRPAYGKQCLDCERRYLINEALIDARMDSEELSQRVTITRRVV